jgi:hypothetical protein
MKSGFLRFFTASLKIFKEKSSKKKNDKPEKKSKNVRENRMIDATADAPTQEQAPQDEALVPVQACQAVWTMEWEALTHGAETGAGIAKPPLGIIWPMGDVQAIEGVLRETGREEEHLIIR